MKKGYIPLLTLSLMAVPTLLWATTAPQDKMKQTTGAPAAQAPTKPGTPPTTSPGTAKIVTPGQATPSMAPANAAKIVTPAATPPAIATPTPHNSASSAQATPGAPSAAPANAAKVVTPPAAKETTADSKTKPAVFSQETHDKLKSATVKDAASAPANMAACPTFKRRPGFLKRVKGEGAKTSYEPTGPSWTDDQKNMWYVIDQSATEAATLLDKKAPKRPYFSTKKPAIVSASTTRTDGKAFTGCKYIVSNKKDVGRQTTMVFVLYPVQ
ncbi:MAG: hypothetical protein H2057_06375 [Alphaproteobacteria bacterium]|nr:hypothetical protein [Alphaproteobacteria bacterium]